MRRWCLKLVPKYCYKCAESKQLETNERKEWIAANGVLKWLHSDLCIFWKTKAPQAFNWTELLEHTNSWQINVQKLWVDGKIYMVHLVRQQTVVEIVCLHCLLDWKPFSNILGSISNISVLVKAYVLQPNSPQLFSSQKEASNTRCNNCQPKK